VNTQKAPLQFHPISYNPDSPVPHEIQKFAAIINSIYPRVLGFHGIKREEEYQSARYYLRNHPHFSRYAVESFTQWLSGHVSPLPIATPQYCDPTSINNYPEKCIIEISPVTIPFYESRIASHKIHTSRANILGIPLGKKQITQYKPMERIEVGSYHCRMFELVEQDMPDDLALQFAYRITFIRSVENEWEARGHLLPFTLVKQAVNFLKQGPASVLFLFSSLLAEYGIDRKEMLQDFQLNRITHVAARVILDEHRTSFMGEFSSDDEAILTSPVYYYGTSRGGGFQLYTPHTRIDSNDTQLENFMNEAGVSHLVFIVTERCAQRKSPHDMSDGLARIHHIHGWTCLAILDSLYDGRPGSSSTFFTQGIWNFDVMCKISRNAYPDIWNRFDQCGIKIELVS